MRERRDQQLSISRILPRNEIGRELEAMSKIIDEIPGILEPIYEDLVGSRSAETGRSGMTVEQVLRCVILK